jgi:hypothetical protein
MLNPKQAHLKEHDLKKQSQIMESQVDITAFGIKDYEKIIRFRGLKNKANSNPNEAGF